MNTKVLLRTVDKIEVLKESLENSSFEFKVYADKIEISVPFLRIKDFEKIIKKYLNAPFNYVNVKFPEEKLNILIFPEKTFSVNDKQTDRMAKEWALSKGLSEPETRWTAVY